ncbi:MAG: nucleotidyltransferase domain-containing protein [Planctomycetota bacterium]
MRKTDLISALFPKTRRCILAATLMHPERWWFLADLARHIGMSSSSLQREMASLVEAGILLRREEGKHVYFKPDTSCPIFPELQGIMTKTLGLVDVLRGTLGPLRKSIRAAFVYGSIARGEEISESDVDLMVLGDTTLSDLSPKLTGAEQQLARQINPTVFSPEEFSRKLREGHHFLTSVIKTQKLFIIGGPDDLARIAQHEARPAARND